VKLDPDTNTLTFENREELQALHDQLSVLVRMAMVQTTRHEEDADKAKELSKGVMQDLHTVMRFLNVARQHLPRHGS
jgi:hypothetical protein